MKVYKIFFFLKLIHSKNHAFFKKQKSFVSFFFLFFCRLLLSLNAIRGFFFLARSHGRLRNTLFCSKHLRIPSKKKIEKTSKIFFFPSLHGSKQSVGHDTLKRFSLNIWRLLQKQIQKDECVRPVCHRGISSKLLQIAGISLGCSQKEHGAVL